MLDIIVSRIYFHIYRRHHGIDETENQYQSFALRLTRNTFSRNSMESPVR